VDYACVSSKQTIYFTQSSKYLLVLDFIVLDFGLQLSRRLQSYLFTHGEQR
jgi:hypothetical protein